VTPRGRTVGLLVIAFVPWACLLIFQAIAILLVSIVYSAGDLGACLDTGALPTLAMLWLAGRR